MKNTDRPTYVNFTLIKITAALHALLGSILLVLSGPALFALPGIVFWLCFLGGLYLFVPGILISFGLVKRSAAKSLSRFLIPFWKIFP